MNKKTLRVYLVLEKKSSQLFNFSHEFIRLAERNIPFIIGWHAGDRIYVKDSNGRKRNAFACLNTKHLASNKNAVSIINYSIAQHCNFDIDIIEDKVVFIISSGDEKVISFIKKFKEDLFHPQN